MNTLKPDPARNDGANDVAKPEPKLEANENATKSVTRDDSVQPATNNQQPIAAQPVGSEYYNRFRIKPQPNVLDNFYNYTYTASVYLMTEVQYRRLLQSASKNIDGWQLLFQSAGSQNYTSNPQGTTAQTANTGERSLPAVEFVADSPFPKDYYIDSIVFENAVPGKATGAAHMVSNLTFTVIEPNGITLIDKLAAKVQNFRTPEMQGKPVNYAAAFYVMVIRWFGYDENGKQVQITGGLVDQEGVSQPGAVIERFIPFRIKHIKFAVTSSLVTYTWECAVIGQLLGSYAGRGTVPADIELSAKTVGEILGGLVGTPAGGVATQAADDNRSRTTTVWGGIQRESEVRDSEAPNSGTPFTPQVPNAGSSQTITKNLVKFLNDYQQGLVKKGIFDKADQYEIVFLGTDANDLFGARLELLDKNITKRRTSAGAPLSKNADGLNPDKGYVDLKTRNSPIVAGMAIVQVIDLLIRNSTFITGQSLLIYDDAGNAQVNENRKNAPLKWFNISMHAVPLQWDDKRNDHAYKIVYTISSRLVKNVVSRYFVSPKFDGVVKRYPYWFTGQNTAVLDYREDLNTLYQFTVSGGRDAAGKEIENVRNSALIQGTFSLLDLASFVWQPRSTETSAGESGSALENVANFAEQLYSPGDLKEITMRILGDPAWIAQGSVLRAPNNEMFGGVSVEQGFLADGTIAFENQDVLFEVAWQKPDDYDIGTGLADPYANSNTINRNPLQSRIFLIKKVVTELSRGKFEQVLYGSQLLIPISLNGDVSTGPLTPSTQQGPITAIDPNDRNAAAFGRQISAPVAATQTTGNSTVTNTAAASGARYDNAAVAAPAVNTTGPTQTASNGRVEAPGLSLPPPPKAPTDGTNNSVAGNANKGPPPNLAGLQANVARLEAEEKALYKEYNSARGGRDFLSGAALDEWEKRAAANDRALGRARYDLRQAQTMARES